MTPESLALITEEIERAHTMAARGADQVAAQTFALVRGMCVASAGRDELTKRLDAVGKGFTREREKYRTLIASRFATGRPLVVIADSLGLPRLDDTEGEYHGAERTYPYLLGEHFGDRAVDSYCQRYFTTQEVLELLLAEPDLGRSSDVLLHVGLNDCATRMFTEPDRLSLDLLPEKLKSLIVDFAQKYRSVILRELPPCHYVPPDRFSANLDATLALLNERGARVVVTTIIMPLVRYWVRTPGIQRNFTNYNLRVMDAAHRHGAALLDMDRLVWDQQHTQVLLADGMHLSVKGHQLLTRFAANLMP